MDAPTRNPSSPAFRHDINALRAFAVVAVLLFHLGTRLTGGFVGVDVFYVISGFLMTEIIGAGVKDGRGLFGFYIARARRIVPALAGMCLVVVLASFVAVDPIESFGISRDALSSLLFYSNFHYWFTAPYFGSPAATHFLLHTWSLAVEWQFYLLYPLVFLGCAALRVRPLIVVVVLSVASFALALFVFGKNPDLGFFMLPTRAWEMGAGGLVAFAPPIASRALRGGLAGLGWTTLLVSVFAIGAAPGWPNAVTLVPVLGTCAVIAGRTQATPIIRNVAVDTLGRISYSLYLWHWPLISWSQYMGYELTLPVALVLLAAMLALALASYHAIERPALRVRTLRQAYFPIGLFALAVLAAMLGIATHGLRDRAGPATLRAIDDTIGARGSSGLSPACALSDTAARGRPLCAIAPNAPNLVLVVGDSFAAQYFDRFQNLARSNPALGFRFAVQFGCPPLPLVNRVKSGMRCLNAYALARREWMTGGYRSVVLIGIWPGYLSPQDDRWSPLLSCIVQHGSCKVPQDSRGFDPAFAAFHRDLLEMTRRGIRPIVVLPSPTMPAPMLSLPLPLDVVRRAYFGLGGEPPIDAAVFRAQAEYARKSLVAAAAGTGTALFDPTRTLCDRQHCLIRGPSGHIAYRDGAHWRSDYVVSAPFSELDRLILQNSGKTAAKR